MKVLRKRVNQPLEVVETNEKWFVPCSKSFFDKDVFTERIYLQGYEFIMVVDEDGIMKELPLNFFLSFNNPHFPYQCIVGDVVFIRNKPVDYEGEIFDWEVTDVTQEDIDLVTHFLRPSIQAFLRQFFEREC